MSSTDELAWAAGLFEGEGSIGRERLQLKMISEESVRRFGAVVGVGDVYGPYGPYDSQLGNRPYFVWVARRAEDVVIACERLRPLLSPSFAARLPHVPEVAS